MSGTHSKSIVVNQSVPLPDEKPLTRSIRSLSSHRGYCVEIANVNAARFVILDALQRLSIETESSP